MHEVLYDTQFVSKMVVLILSVLLVLPRIFLDLYYGRDLS